MARIADLQFGLVCLAQQLARLLHPKVDEKLRG
jgi:hypothetical protein